MFGNETEIEPVRLLERCSPTDGSVMTTQSPKSNTTLSPLEIWATARRTILAVRRRQTYRVPILIPDVIGVVKEVYELGSVTSKATQKPVSLAIDDPHPPLLKLVCQTRFAAC